MTTDQARDVLQRFVTEHQQRLATANRRRAAMHAAVARGEVPEANPGYQWLQEVVPLLINVLAQSTQEYNARRGWLGDGLTMHDWLDALETCKATVRTCYETPHR